MDQALLLGTVGTGMNIGRGPFATDRAEQRPKGCWLLKSICDLKGCGASSPSSLCWVITQGEVMRREAVSG